MFHVSGIFTDTTLLINSYTGLSYLRKNHLFMVSMREINFFYLLYMLLFRGQGGEGLFWRGKFTGVASSTVSRRSANLVEVYDAAERISQNEDDPNNIRFYEEKCR